ncbi:MAG: hypothetical protein RI887_920, partial [Actinomycetota bacterium]
MTKTKVAIICGGKSSEHEISCISANGVLEAIDRNLFEVVLIGITKAGKWLLLPTQTSFRIQNGVLPTIPNTGVEVSITSDGLIADGKKLEVDVAFPILHGPYGEDGTIQGLFEIIQLRYVGSGVLASAVSMDKSYAKPIFAASGLSVLGAGAIAGVHLEGPYLARARCGAHNPNLLKSPTISEVQRLIEVGEGAIRMITIAPELENSLEVISYLSRNMIIAAIGHSNGNYDDALKAVDAGAALVTHFSNGM